MKKKNTIPSTFEQAFNGLGYDNTENTTEVTNMDYKDSLVDVESLFDDDDPEPKGTEDTVPEQKPDSVINENDDTQVPKEVLEQMNNNQTTVSEGLNTEDTTEPSKAEIAEAKKVGAFFDAVAEKFGWSDIDDEERPVNIEEFTQYIQDVVDQNSVPQYADERIELLDKFVKNGGKFEDFYLIQQRELNYDNLDITEEYNQKAVVTDLLKANGYTDEQISRKIQRYEDADTLEEEAEEALEKMKQIRKYESEQLAKQQEIANRRALEQQQAFFNDVSTQIKSLDNIRGISVPKEDRKALFEYIFKTDADGITQYQKDFNKNLSKNLIESAYFTMKADQFVNQAKKVGLTTAAQKLRQMLRHTGKNHSAFNADDDKQRPAWEIASSLLQ